MSLQVLQKRKSEDNMQPQIEARARDVAVEKEWANQMKYILVVMSTAQITLCRNYCQTTKASSRWPALLLQLRNGSPGLTMAQVEEDVLNVGHYRCMECLVGDQRQSRGRRYTGKMNEKSLASKEDGTPLRV
jgi:hypothetical protein